MYKICFVCLGNICRSPMAEFIMKDKLKKAGITDILVESRATSYEEMGNDMYPPAKDMLDQMNISYTRHCATRLEESDSLKYDIFICMEERNVINSKRILGDNAKIVKLLDKDIADPWYNGDFLTTYNEINIGIDKIIKEIVK